MPFRAALLLAILAAIPSFSQPAQIYHDPKGRFSLEAPPAWTTAPVGGGGVEFSNSTASVMVLVASGSDQHAALESVLGRFRSQSPSFKTEDRGEIQINGRDWSYVVAHAVNPKGVQDRLQFIAAGGEDGVCVLVFDAPATEYQRLESLFIRIARSFRFGRDPSAGGYGQKNGAEVDAAGRESGQPGAVYKDPQGRFTVAAPPGWTTEAEGANRVNISKGQAHASVGIIKGYDNPSSAIDQIGRQIQGQWRTFRIVDDGQTDNVSGRTGYYAIFVGADERGVEHWLRLTIAADKEGRLYVVMLEAPCAQLEGVNDSFGRISKSFRIGAGLGPSPRSIPRSPARTAPTSHPDGAVGHAPAPTPMMETGEIPAYFRMRKATVVDQKWFGTPMPALSMLVPVDWKLEGDAPSPNSPTCPLMGDLTFRATSPDGLTAIEWFPSFQWLWTTDPRLMQALQKSNEDRRQVGKSPCEIKPYMPPAEFVKRVIVPRFRPNAEVVTFEAVPELDRVVQDVAHRQEAEGGKLGLRLHAEVTRALLRYAVNGQPVEEFLYAITVQSGPHLPIHDPLTGRTADGIALLSTWGVFGMRAPQGRLLVNEKLFELVIGTLRRDPEWQSRIQKLAGNMIEIDQATARYANLQAALRTQMRTETQDYLRQQRRAETAYQNELGRELQDETSQTIRGVEPYENPITHETIELPAMYRNAWAGANGNYFVTDSDIDPNTVFKDQPWTRAVKKIP